MMTSKTLKTLATASACSLVVIPALAQTVPLRVPTAHTAPSRPHTGCGLVDLKGMPTGRDYDAIPGTVALSCDVTPSIAEYTGQGNDEEVILDTLWMISPFGIVADDRYRMTTTFTPATQKLGGMDSRFSIKYMDDYVAVKANNAPDQPTLVEVFDKTGKVARAKSCAEVDITAAKTENCTPTAPFVDIKTFLGAQSQLAQDAKDYVSFLAHGNSLTVSYYDGNAARQRLANIALFVRAAKASP